MQIQIQNQFFQNFPKISKMFCVALLCNSKLFSSVDGGWRTEYVDPYEVHGAIVGY